MSCVIRHNTIIEVGGYGKQSDGGTFRLSALFHSLQNGTLNVPPDNALPSTNIIMPYVFIGDEAYPLMRNLLTPYSRRQLNLEKEYFNMRLSRARHCVECAFGILNAKWRWKPIECLPETADKIIKCICVLHNTVIDMEGCELRNVDLNTGHNFIRMERQTTRPTEQAKTI